MKTKIIPFDLETAKDIQDGKIKGRIRQKHAFCFWFKMSCGSASGLLNFNDDRAESSSIEVIGNIYDSEELLKGGKL